MSKPTVIVYGATAFSAKELILYLDNHAEAEKFKVILAGRSRTKLESAAAKLQKKHEIVVCELTDEEGVRELVARGNVVINVAGPYSKHNAEAIIKECVEAGKHYVDLTGEGHWLATEIIPKYDFLATKTGACIVPSCGFDSIPSDLTMYASLKKLQQQYPEASITSSIAYFKLRASISGGTIDSMRTAAEIPNQKRGEWILVGRGGQTGPATKPKLIYETTHPSIDRPLIGSYFFMYPYNRCIVRRSWYLSRLDRQHQTPSSSEASLLSAKVQKEGEEPVHGDKLVYEEAMELGTRFKAFLGSALLMLFGIFFFGNRVTRNILSYFLPKVGTGASEEQLRKGYMEITSISKTTQKGVEVITTCKGKGDPGYIITTYMLAESALSLILPPPAGTSLPPLARQGGLLTPSTAFGQVLIERLQKAGKVQWHSELVESKKGV